MRQRNRELRERNLDACENTLNPKAGYRESDLSAILARKTPAAR
jgi:hypothetical protein